MTSQVPVEGWYEIIGNPIIADAHLDGLVHNAIGSSSEARASAASAPKRSSDPRRNPGHHHHTTPSVEPPSAEPFHEGRKRIGTGGRELLKTAAG